MLCQHCKKRQSTIHYTVYLANKLENFNYCPECYHSLFGSLKYGENEFGGLLLDREDVNRSCPVCKTTLSDYKSTGLLGCPSCYDFFRSELIKSIKRIQGKDSHVGKVGKDYVDHELMRELQELQAKLETALRNRRYSEAGMLNKRMTEITKILYGDKNDG